MERLVIFCVISILTIVSANKVHEMKMGKKFTWRNCGPSGAPLSFKSLSVSPNPLKYGQNLILSGEMDVKQDIGITNTLQAETKAFLIYNGDRKADMCQYSPDACNIKDLCAKIAQSKLPCPKVVEKEGSNCKCPLKKNTYKAKDVAIMIPNSHVQVEGQFEMTVNILESGKSVGCLYMEFCLGDCSTD